MSAWRPPAVASCFVILLLVFGPIPSRAAASNVTVSPDEDPLLAFKSSIQQDPFGALDNWVAGYLCTNWSHVVCDSQLRVISLNLQNQLLVASSISSTLSQLTFLQNLNLENNSFGGNIPSGFGNLIRLQELRLGRNPLTGIIPFELTTLTGLFYLNIGRTSISGNLPPTVQNLQNLSFLFLDNTDLSGPIPQQIGSLTKLQFLHVYHDVPTPGAGGLTGDLPDLGSLSSLQELNLANNDLTGSMPASYSNLQELTTLNVSGNELSGPIPSGVFDLRALKHFDISSNNFSGTIVMGTIPDFRYDNNPLLLPLSDCTGNCSRGSKFGVVVIVIVVALVFIVGAVVGILGCRWYTRRGPWRFQKHTSDHFVELQSTKPAPPPEIMLPVHTRSFTLEELIVATNNFDPELLLGSGGFGTVYRGRLAKNQDVAIKRAGQHSQQGMKEFCNEVEVLSKIHHKHLANLIGFCADSGEQMLIYEYVPNGSLLEHLTGQRGPPLTWRQRINIAICASKGLAYLHEGCSPSIIHRDIKPSNILVDFEYEAKVSDFGLSKLGPSAGQTHVSTGVKGTPGYLDPYYYLSFHLSTWSDVYSFGVILLQLVSAKPAVDHSRKRSEYNIINWAKSSVEAGNIEAVMDPMLLQQNYNRDIMLHMAALGLRCVNKEVKSRPSMTEISQELELVLRTYDTRARRPDGDEAEARRNIVKSPRFDNDEHSYDFYEQERFYPEESQNSMDGSDTGMGRRISISMTSGEVSGPVASAEFRRRSSAESSADVYLRTPSSSGSMYVFPLDRAESNIKFDGMTWVDIKNIDDERLHQFSGAIAYEEKLHEFTGNIELSGTLEQYYPQKAVKAKTAPKSSPL